MFPGFPARISDMRNRFSALSSETTSNNAAPAHAHYKQQSGMYGIVGICVPESFVFSSKDPTCCDLLRAFAHIAQQETKLLAQQCCGLL